MIIRSEQSDKNSLILFLSGRLDTASSSVFEIKITELVDTALDVVLDLKDLTYISSSGLHVLLQVQKKLAANEHKLIVRNANGLVKDVFIMTGFNNIVAMEE